MKEHEILMQKLGGAVEADYKGLKIDVPKFDTNIAMDRLQKLSREDRLGMMILLEGDIDMALPKLATMSSEDVLLCLQDIAIWWANEIYEGRQTS